MKKWKQAFAMALTVTMTLALTACGGGSGSNSGGSSGTSTATTSADSKEGVFELQPYDIASLVDEDADDYYISYTTVADDRLWFLLTVYNYGDDNDSNGNEFYFVSMNTDGTDVQKIEPEFWQDGVNPYRTEDGTAAPEDSADTTDTADGADTNEGIGDVVDPDQEDEPYTWESRGITSMTVTADGQIAGIKSYYYETSETTDENGNNTYINPQFVTCWNADGSLAWETELTGLQTDESYSYVSAFATDADGEIVLFISGDQSGIMKVGEDGTFGEIRQSDTISTFIDDYSYMQDNRDGTLTVLYYNTEDYATQYIATYDIAADTLSEPVTVPSSVSYNMQGNFSLTSDGSLWYETSTGIYRYQSGAETGEQVMNFINSDLYTNYFGSMIVLDEQHIIAFYYEDSDTGYSITSGGLFTYVAPEDIPDKVTVTIGANGVDYELRQRVVDFNKQSDTTRITIRDYSEYNSYDDYEAWKTQLNNDILGGNMPDILEVSSLGGISSYASKGLLADVDELIANDPELAGTEFMDNAFESHRIDGTLYEVFPYFNVSTYVAKTSLVGDKTSLTMDEAQQIASSMGEDAKVVSSLTRDYFFNSVMSYVGREYVDVSTGTCNFDSDAFVSLLEYAKTLTTEEELEDAYEQDETVYDEFYGNDSQYRENETLLGSLWISNISDINYTLNGTFGEDISYVGFPNDGGCNGVIYVSTSYVLSAKSEVLDQAWDFISFYLKDEYQSEISYGLPVSRTAFETQAQKALEKPYYEDADGNKVEYDDYYYLNGEEFVLPQMTQEQIDAAVSYIESVTTAYYNDSDVIDIINEEAEAFYSGQKSAEDVAKIIQSRVQIYVQENS